MPGIQKAHVDDALELMELPPEDVLAGEPQSRNKMLPHVAGDMTGGVSGLFSADPGSVRAPLAASETFYIVEGRSRIDNGSGESTALNAGDLAVVPAGDWTWTFETPFLCVFVAGPALAAAPETAEQAQP